MACGQQEAAKSNSTVKQGSMKEKINEDVKKKTDPQIMANKYCNQNPGHIPTRIQLTTVW